MKPLALAALIAAMITPAHAQVTGYENAGAFITEYKDGSNIYARLYIRGVGEGLGWYNSLLDTELWASQPTANPSTLLSLTRSTFR